MFKRLLKTISIIIAPACVFFIMGYVIGFAYSDAQRSTFYEYFLYMLPVLLFSGLMAGCIYWFAAHNSMKN